MRSKQTLTLLECLIICTPLPPRSDSTIFFNVRYILLWAIILLHSGRHHTVPQCTHNDILSTYRGKSVKIRMSKRHIIGKYVRLVSPSMPIAAQYFIYRV